MLSSISSGPEAEPAPAAQELVVERPETPVVTEPASLEGDEIQGIEAAEVEVDESLQPEGTKDIQTSVPGAPLEPRPPTEQVLSCS